MKTLKLNKNWRARKIGRSVYVFTRWMETTISGRPLEDVARKITKAMVQRVLKRRGEFELPIKEGRSRGNLLIWYSAKRNAKYITIGCQRFPLTKVKELLSLFP